MGPAYVSDSLTAARRAAGALALAALLAGPLVAQAPLSREFERMWFARREVWVDRLFTAADAKARKRAVPLLAKAMKHRGYADSLAGGRARALSAAAASLLGREPDPFFQRFNWFLLGLPEVVDPRKTDGDRAKLGELTRKVYPLLRPVEVADPKALAKDADKIFVTARGVFGFEKPKDLRLRFAITDGAGEVVATEERGDSERDPKSGWLMFDLFSSFAMAGREAGAYRASCAVGAAGTWPAADDPPLATTFHVHPGYFGELWGLLELRARLAGRGDGAAPPRDATLRLELLTDEALRVVMGKEYLLRSWPTQALGKAIALGRTLEAGATEPMPERGDRVFGIAVEDPRVKNVLPARIVWSGKRDEARRATIVLPPSGFDENWAIDGLGISAKELQTTGEVWVFTPFPTAKGYLQELQRRLVRDFGVAPGRVRVAGFLDGGTRARYALGLFAEPPAELVLVGRTVPDKFMFGDKGVGRVRVVPAYGQPSAKRMAAAAKLVPPGKVEWGGVGPRSLSEAFRLVMEK